MESSKKSLRKIPPNLLDSVVEGDCLDIVAQLPQACVDLIYVDPPFLTQKKHTLTTRDRSKTFSFSDLWKSHEEYAEFLYKRLVLAERVLAETGSLYFHCDRNAVHIARAVLDEVFGVSSFRSEIIWTYRRWSNSRNGLLPSHQNIFCYTKSVDFVFNPLFVDYSPSTNVDQILQQRARDSTGKSIYRKDTNGAVLSNGAKRGVPLGDVWDIPYLNPKAKERVGYPTQKPILLVERIIQLSTNKGDLVLDPCCGSGTTLVAAKLMGRNFIGVDISRDACDLSLSRLAAPIKSESALLESGREAYVNADSQLLQLLVGCDYVPVQRNNGIDAIVNLRENNSIALVRIQRKNETLSEACDSIRKAASSKNASRLIVVRTCNAVSLLPDDEIGDGVHVIDSTSFAINSLLHDVAAISKK